MRETSTVATPPVQVATGSHVGRVRATNEDRVYSDPERGSFAVIDGVGGQAAGEFAAQIAHDTIRQRLQLQIGTPAERVREAIALANDHIHQEAQIHQDRHGMACVLTLVLLHHGTLTAGHVGDTRLYKLRGGTLWKLTHDHSPIGEREDRGELSESEAMRHPRRNEVYREVGAEPRRPDAEGFIEVVEEPFERDAALLLCTDGLSDALSRDAITTIIERHAGNPALIVEQLIEQANDASGKDNVSVVYVEGAGFANSVRHSSTAVADSRPATGANRQTNASADQKPSTTAASSSSSSRVHGYRPPPVAATPHRRVLAFVAGLLTGVAIALGVAYAMRDALIPRIQPTSTAPRVLTVGTAIGAPFRTISDALVAARPGDIVRVNPGEYREQLVVPDGVTVTATSAREAVVRAPANALRPWTAVIATGDRQGTRVSGLRIIGDAQGPIAVGVQALGRVVLDDLEITGTTTAGVAFDGSTLSLLSSSFHDNAGSGVTLNGGEARVAHNVFTHNGTGATPTGPDIALTGTPRVVFAGNVIGGELSQRLRGLPADQLGRFRETNVVLPPPPAVARRTVTPRRVPR